MHERQFEIVDPSQVVQLLLQEEHVLVPAMRYWPLPQGAVQEVGGLAESGFQSVRHVMQCVLEESEQVRQVGSQLRHYRVVPGSGN